MVATPQSINHLHSVGMYIYFKTYSPGLFIYQIEKCWICVADPAGLTAEGI